MLMDAELLMGATALFAVVSAIAVGLAVRHGTCSGAISIVAAFVGLATAWWAYEHTTGYASNAPLPPQFRLLQAHVVEPAPSQGRDGAIYLWVEALDGAAAPRVHELAYTRSLHQTVQAAMETTKDARHRVGRVTRRHQGAPSLRFEPRALRARRAKSETTN